MLLGIFLFSNELFLGLHSLVGHFSVCPLASQMLTVFCCVTFHDPHLEGGDPLGFKELDVERQGSAGRGSPSSEVQRIQVVVLIHLVL